MTRCPIHTTFFKTENTPCPACREAFDNDLPAQVNVSPGIPLDWSRSKMQEQYVETEALHDQIVELRESLVIYALVAVIGWSIVIAGGLSWIVADYAIGVL